MTYVRVHLEGKLLLAIGASLGGIIVIELLVKNTSKIDFAMKSGDLYVQEVLELIGSA